MNSFDLSKEFVRDYLQAYKISGFPKDGMFSLGVVESLMQTAYVEGYGAAYKVMEMDKEESRFIEKIEVKYLDEGKL